MEVDTLATLGIDIQTDKAKASLDSLNTSMKQTTDAAKQMTNAFGPTTGGANEIFGPIVPGATAAANSTKQLASEMLKGTEVTRGFRDIMHTMDPILMSAGASMGGLGAFAMAARAGVAGLGIAIAGGLTVELARVGDESVTAKDKLSDFFNSTTAGSAAFDRLQQTASTFGGTVAGLVPSLTSLTRTLQEQERVSGVVYAPLASGLSTVGQRAAALQETLLGYARASGSTWSEATASVTKLSSAIQNAKQFTSDLYKQIEQESPKLANALANAFGYNGEDAVVRFNAALKASPRSIQDLITALASLQGASKKAFEESGSGFATFTQGLDTTWNSLKRMVEAFADGTHLSQGLSSALKDLNQSLLSAANGWAHLGDFIKTIDTPMKALTLDAELAWGALNKLFGFQWQASGIISAINLVVAHLDDIVAAAKSAAEWLAKALPGGGDRGPLPEAPQYPGVMGGYNAAQAGAGGGLNPPSQEAAGGGGGFGGGAANEGGGDFPGGMATGGSFTVGGDGGIDTTKVSFMATRGEHVSVTPFGRTSTGYGSGHFADGGDFTVDQNSTLTGSKPDQAAMPSGLALSNTLTNMSGTFEKLGITIGDIGKTITGAGNDKMIDVVRLGTMQTIAAIQMAGDKTVNAIAALNNTDQQIIASISSLSSSISAATATSAGSSAGGSSAGTGSATPTTASRGGGAGKTSSLDGMHISSSPSAADLAADKKAYDAQIAAGNADLANRNALQKAINSSNPRDAATVSASSPGPAGATGSGIKQASPYYDENAGIPTSADMDFAASYGDAYADGGDFDVPLGHDNDSYPMRVQSGEHVKVTPKHLNKPGSGGAGVGNVTVIIQTQDLKSFVNTEAQTGQQVRRMLDRSMAKR